MAGAGYRTFQSGEVLTSTNVQTYLMDQAVQVYAGTAARSSAVPSPSTGMVAYSTATGLQVFNGSAWVNVGSQVLAVDFMLSGGGGGGSRSASPGGGFSAGGGGAGGFVTGSSILGKTTYVVKIGAGGAGATTDDGQGQSGFASGFINTANGGGCGASRVDPAQNGASGGGATAGGGAGSGISGEGFAGGTSSASANGGGGGGSASVGGNGSGTTGGAGGTATANSYTGSSISYSGGGGGGGTTVGGTAGTNAGNGGGNAAGSNATANRGGGGGGGGDGENGGNGGSGEVVIRYLTADATGLTITTTGSPTTGTSGAYSYLQYTATGTLVIA